MCRWEDSTKMNLKEIGCEDVDWIQMVQDGSTLVGSYKHGNELSDPVKGREFLNQLSN